MRRTTPGRTLTLRIPHTNLPEAPGTTGEVGTRVLHLELLGCFDEAAVPQVGSTYEQFGSGGHAHLVRELPEPAGVLIDRLQLPGHAGLRHVEPQRIAERLAPQSDGDDCRVALQRSSGRRCVSVAGLPSRCTHDSGRQCTAEEVASAHGSTPAE